MSISTVREEIALTEVQVTADELIVKLTDGRKIQVPLEWFPRLLHGTHAERQNCEIFGEGSAIEWPDLDEHIGVEGLLAGRRSGESKKSIARWLESRRS